MYTLLFILSHLKKRKTTMCVTFVKHDFSHCVIKRFWYAVQRYSAYHLKWYRILWEQISRKAKSARRIMFRVPEVLSKWVILIFGLDVGFFWQTLCFWSKIYSSSDVFEMWNFEIFRTWSITIGFTLTFNQIHKKYHILTKNNSIRQTFDKSVYIVISNDMISVI